MQIKELIDRIVKAIEKIILIEDDTAYTVDPVFGIVRNRVCAEIVKSFIRLGYDSTITEKLVIFLLRKQNEDGSWNEIHPNYNQPSSLVTSIAGDALLDYYEIFPIQDIEESIHIAKDFILSQEKFPGYFIKSKIYTADHLNVDATCGAFLAKYGKIFTNQESIEAAKRAAKQVCEYQFKNGAYPYTVNKGNYPYPLRIPCIHYQGVTMYYLSKINEVIKEDWLKDSLLKGAAWLSASQKRNGGFNWSKSGLMFAYHLVGAYAFAFAAFTYVNRWNKIYQENAKSCLNILRKNIHEGLVLRWEKDSWITFPLSIPINLKASLIGEYPFKHRVFRFGYGLYREVARRKFATQINDKIFQNITKFLNIKSSTIEPFNNYPDLFMTSEVLDCLSYHLSPREEYHVV